MRPARIRRPGSTSRSSPTSSVNGSAHLRGRAAADPRTFAFLEGSSCSRRSGAFPRRWRPCDGRGRADEPAAGPAAETAKAEVLLRCGGRGRSRGLDDVLEIDPVNCRPGSAAAARPLPPATPRGPWPTPAPRSAAAPLSPGPAARRRWRPGGPATQRCRASSPHGRRPQAPSRGGHRLLAGFLERVRRDFAAAPRAAATEAAAVPRPRQYGPGRRQLADEPRSRSGPRWPRA